MKERKDIPEEFRKAFEIEDAFEERREMAELIYKVGSFIIQRDFYRGREVNRKIIEQRYARTMRLRASNFPGLNDAVGIIVQRFAYGGLLSPVKQRSMQQPFRRSTKFTFRVDDDAVASYYEHLAYFGEQASLDAEQVARYRRTAVSIRRNIERTNRENFQY